MLYLHIIKWGSGGNPGKQVNAESVQSFRSDGIPGISSMSMKVWNVAE